MALEILARQMTGDRRIRGKRVDERAPAVAGPPRG
jgi:hypothetical protein